MKISTLKIVGLGILSLLMMTGGLVSTAWFAVDQLQSWPRALMEARPVVYGQILLGVSLGLASEKWRRRLGLLTVMAMVAALFGGAWALSATPPDRFGMCLWGMVAYISVGGVIFAEFVREISRKDISSPRTGGGNPALN